MKTRIPYLRGSVSIEIPDSCDFATLEPNECPLLPGAVERAVRHPRGAPPLAEFLSGCRNLLLVVNDATRPTPTRLVLDAIAGELGNLGPKAGDEGARLRLIVATGAHRGPTEEEYRQILGPHYDRLRPLAFAHDARAPETMIDLGKTRNGTPILMDRAVVEADRILVVGSVEPHYFAGYTGGRKAFLPGLAGYATIEANHRLALSPKARTLALEDNPVSQDMDDALDLIGAPIFSIMTVLDKDQGLAWCSAGDIGASFLEAVEKADAVFCVPIGAPFDLVVSAARPPMDIDLYQSQKAIENGALALADGGVLILVSSCREGVGDRTFLDLMGSASSPDEVLEKISGGYRLGYHKAAKLALIERRAEVWASTGLGPAVLEKAFIRPFADPQAAVDEAIARHRAAHGGREPRVCVIPDGTVTVPLLRAR